MRHWTAEERTRQAELIRCWEPWKTAGVKTAEGKSISRMNATKHGAYGVDVKAARRQLRECKRVLEEVKQIEISVN